MELKQQMNRYMNDQKQVEIFNTSEYFKTVDRVCFAKDCKGSKFNLLNYVNEDRYFITEKTSKS